MNTNEMKAFADYDTVGAYMAYLVRTGKKYACNGDYEKFLKVSKLYVAVVEEMMNTTCPFGDEYHDNLYNMLRDHYETIKHNPDLLKDWLNK